MDFQQILERMNFDSFLNLIDSLYDEIVVFDNNYTIVYINRACQRHYGMDPDELIGQSSLTLLNLNIWNNPVLPTIYETKKAYAVRQNTQTGSEIISIGVPVFDDESNLTHVVMNVRDNIYETDIYNPHYFAPGDELSDEILDEEPVCVSPRTQKAFSLAKRVAPLDITCLLTGESGTGKTMLAKYIHSKSGRKDKPFVSLNCAAIPENLIESELFGFEKGSFTGANSQGKIGLFKAADGGTLLLDEITELSLAAQSKLLQVIQDGEYFPIGTTKPVKVDTRVIAATNRNIEELVGNGQFREDLYYRLNIVDIYMPPLRRRREDIRPLIARYLNQFCNKYSIARQFSPAALDALEEYIWPGNIRELAHTLERIAVISDHIIIDVSDLPKSMFGIVETDDFSNPDQSATFDEKIDAYTSYLINDAYDKCGSSRKVASLLGISQTKANNLIKKYVRNRL